MGKNAVQKKIDVNALSLNATEVFNQTCTLYT
jgi:hypothetical protein